ARKNLKAAASSRKPMTTLTEFNQEPLLGSLRNKVGNRARKKNGEAKVAENARPPSRLCQNGRAVAAVPLKPPRKGATHAKLMMVNVSAMNTVPTKPPLPSRDDVYCARLCGNSISYTPNRLSAKNMNSPPMK